MEKIFNIAKSSKNHFNYNMEAFKTPIKPKPYKYRESILKSFLQDTSNQKNSIKKPVIPLNKNNKIIKIEKQDEPYYNQFIERKGKYENNNQKNNNKRYINNFIPIASFSGNKSKNNINDNSNKKYTILNPFKEKSSSSSKSILIPTNENQISIFKNSENLNVTNINIDNKSYVINSNKKKLKKNNSVYVRKRFSKEKNRKKINNNRKINYNFKDNESDDYYYESNKNNIPRANSTKAMNKIIRNNSNKQNTNTNTNNINSNVNIFNFDMQYNNAPNYFIKNSKMYNPYFNNYLQSNLNSNNELNGFNNIISIKKNNFKENYDEKYNDDLIKLDNDEEMEINSNNNNNKNEQMEEQIFNQSAIIIQSVYRGCVIRFQINNLLKAYKGIEVLDNFFKCKYWKYFRNYLIMKSNILNNEADSKMSISSISCISALFNTNKNFIFKSFNTKLLCKEARESFYIISHSNNNNNQYLETFQNIKNNDEKNNKNIVWNKKKINDKTIINPQKRSSKSVRDSTDKKKEKILRNIIRNYLYHSRLFLLKYFMKFYFNGFSNIKKDNINNNESYSNNIQDIEQFRKKKLLNILYDKESKSRKIIYKTFTKFYYKGLLNYMENHCYYMINGGRLQDIHSNPFFIYRSSKKKLVNNNKPNNNNNNENENRNMYTTLKIIKIFRKIIFQKNRIKEEKIKIYFYKFHLAGIFYYMKKELKKRIIKKRLIIESNNNNNMILFRDEGKKNNNKNILLKKLINAKHKNNMNISKNVFDKWNLRTKIFSIIAIDKEKKKKRRIKKRNNKKLNGNNSNKKTNINNINNINDSNKNEKNISIDLKNKNNSKINTSNNIKQNYIVDHRESVLFFHNLKMNDFLKLNKFIQKIYCILTKKFFFFHLLINIYKQNKTSDKCNNDKSKINEDIDFLIDDSSEQSED